MHNFVVHSNESACRKSGRLGMEQVYIQANIRPICSQTSDPRVNSRDDINIFSHKETSRNKVEFCQEQCLFSREPNNYHNNNIYPSYNVVLVLTTKSLVVYPTSYSDNKPHRVNYSVTGYRIFC